MATQQQGRIVETATEARQAEPGPVGTCPPDHLHRACDIDPRRHLVRVLPYLIYPNKAERRRAAGTHRLERRQAGNYQ